jgi:hypothetical protein
MSDELKKCVQHGDKISPWDTNCGECIAIWSDRQIPRLKYRERIEQLEQELIIANRKLKRIASMAGNPDAQEACRLIIAETVKGDNSYDELNDINLMINKILKGDE